ncbi:ABC transporter substrate-binding protein [Granulicella sp. WH15]|uniref:ABC transporter substrate-binding protein n=1 Tax=Granulicella sp. WH15 TaxID=2602070 RepID=UPI0013673CAB|nr:ABC transporter substrate-binding protein [Granulicella sp. WH15]QHN03568.1 ABC transporter substrate-binding protein [Granulicella sp. WH15]
MSRRATKPGRRWFGLSCALLLLTACTPRHEDPNTAVVLIDSSPTNLDLRIGTDAQSERIGSLIFDPLVRKDEHFQMQPWLATAWSQPDPLTWIFRIRTGVRFHNGQPLTAQDAAYTVNSLIDGTLITSKAGAFEAVSKAEAPTPEILILHLKRPDASLLFNLSDGLFGVVPKNSGKELGRNPVGSGPFRFVSATVDKDVVVARNPEYWAGPAHLERVRFPVVPDAVTVALEMQKGSADIASNDLTLDMVYALRNAKGLITESAPSSTVMYLNFNVADGPLRDKRVRQAIACAIDREAIIRALWRNQAHLAEMLLPPGHWAAASQLPRYPHDIARATRLLDAAGFSPDKQGVRLRLEMKTSTDETTRLLAVILQQQLRPAGIELTLRSAEFGTFYADVTRGAFQMYALKWVGSNEDPDIFRYAYSSDRFPPKGGNRGHYMNARVDELLRQAAATTDEPTRRRAYVEVQQILADELPSIPLWYPNNEIVHTSRITHVTPRGSGSFDFLREAEIHPYR